MAAAALHECSKCKDCGEQLSVIQCLKRYRFSTRTFEEKSEIIEGGSPKPVLNDLTKGSKGKKVFNRHFNVKLYDAFKWLTGCEFVQKLFCWACLLFSQLPTSWNGSGFSDLYNLSGALKSHEESQAHVTATLKLRMFGRETQIEPQIDKQRAESDRMHNEKVERHRSFIKRLIDGVLYLAKRGLAFRTHDEGETSDDRGNYIELVELIADCDTVVKEHLDDATVFSGLSSHIQNDFIQAISETVLDFIKTEIGKAKFVAVIVDEATDISFCSQLSIILRYVSDYTGEPVESFLGFLDVSGDRKADAMSKVVLEKLREFECTAKLVAQTYDGAAVMSGHLNGLQKKVKEHVPYATFVHCYAHKLNLVLSQSASEIHQCRIFFMSLSSIPEFFSSSTKRVEMLDRIVNARLPGAATTRFNSNSRLANAVKNHFDDLLKLFNQITREPKKWEGDSVTRARGFERMLEDFEFCFLLNVFSEVFAITEKLFKLLQKKTVDIAKCSERVNETTKGLSAFNTDEKFEEVFQETVRMVGEPQQRRNSPTKHDLYVLFLSIFDNIVAHMNTRFENIEQLQFLELFDFKKFPTYQNTFPQKAFESLISIYGTLFHSSDRLKNELKTLYASNIFHGVTSVSELHTFMKEESIDVDFCELFTLVQLIITIPASSSSAERSFSALKRIKTYLRSTMTQVRLSALAIISIEKKIVSILEKTKSAFHDSLIKIFCRKDRRRIQLHYK